METGDMREITHTVQQRRFPALNQEPELGFATVGPPPVAIALLLPAVQQARE